MLSGCETKGVNIGGKGINSNRITGGTNLYTFYFKNVMYISLHDLRMKVPYNLVARTHYMLYMALMNPCVNVLVCLFKDAQK